MILGTRQRPRAPYDLADPMIDLSSTRASIYVQLATLFRRFIVRGQWPIGNRIPNHDTLAVQFGVNPATVRKAIASLEAEGLIECSRRRGTYVIAKPPAAERYEIATTWNGALHAYDGLTPKLLESTETKEIPPEFPRSVPARRYRHMRHLYRRGHAPLMVVDSYFDDTVYKKIGKSGLRGLAPISLVERHLKVERVDQTLRFGIAGSEMSKLLRVPLNAPLAILHLSVIGASASHSFASTAYIRGDMIRVAESIRF